MNERNPEEIMAEELESLLAEEFPAEVDAAGLYLTQGPGDDDAHDEKLAGLPGGGVLFLAGPLMVSWLMSIALAILEQIKKEFIGATAKGAIDWLRTRLDRQKSRPSVRGEAETVAEIASALIKAGWKAETAGRAAEKVWHRGERAAARIQGR